jgi:adenylate cyclase
LKPFWIGKALKPIQFGILASIAAALALFLAPSSVLVAPRERFFDALTRWVPAKIDPHIVVVDIDRKTQSSLGGKSWSRSDMARLVNAIADKGPAAVAFDFVFSGHCDRQDADNRALARAIRRAPSILGFLLSDQSADTPEPRPPLIAARNLSVPAAWFAEGVEASCDMFEEQAKAAAGSFLFGDADAEVRRVQAYSIFKGSAYPALALEAVRLGDGPSSPPILTGPPLSLRIGADRIDLSEDGNIRFAASNQPTIAARTISAADLVAGRVPADRLKGQIVFLGSSLPKMGGLRASASMPLEASVQIHADLANGILTRHLPRRDPRLQSYEVLFVLLAGIGIALAASRFRPAGIAGVGFVLVAFTLVLSLVIYATTGLLFDGFSISLTLLCILTITTYIQFARVRATERRARTRFGQYLPKAVVTRYLDAPEGGRLSGETREVTALFTDIEDFSTLAREINSQALVALLDTYFAEVNALVEKHGGMVDKVVGDAVHALFNAPEDLDDHVNKAIACALEIQELTKEMQQRPQFSACRFGRTRIGVETGTAVLGEVGAGGKLDYTAHGPAVNLAARLQDANKFLGTSICIGPQAAASSRVPLRALGAHDIRGFGPIKLFSPDD